jgi:hypothetical protein
VGDLELFRPELDAALARSDRAEGGRQDDRLVREQLTRAGAVEHPLARFDAVLRAAGHDRAQASILDRSWRRRL